MRTASGGSQRSILVYNLLGFPKRSYYATKAWYVTCVSMSMTSDLTLNLAADWDVEQEEAIDLEGHYKYNVTMKKISVWSILCEIPKYDRQMHCKKLHQL